MANELSKLLKADAERCKARLDADSWANLLGGEKGKEADTLNKRISDACSSAEGKILLEKLGEKGTLSNSSITLSGSVVWAKGAKFSGAWTWAVRVNKLSKALSAAFEA